MPVKVIQGERKTGQELAGSGMGDLQKVRETERALFHLLRDDAYLFLWRSNVGWHIKLARKPAVPKIG